MENKLPVTNQYINSPVVDRRNTDLYNDYLSHKKEGIDHISLRLAVKYKLSVSRVNEIIRKQKNKGKRFFKKGENHAGI